MENKDKVQTFQSCRVCECVCAHVNPSDYSAKPVFLQRKGGSLFGHHMKTECHNTRE